MNGSIVKRGNKYSVVYYAFNSSGVRSQVWQSGFNTKKEAEQYLRDYNKRLQRIEPVVKHCTLEKYLTHWLDVYSVQKGLAFNTICGYRVNIYNHIIPSIGHYYLDEISASVLDFLFDDLRAKGLNGTSLRYVYRVLHIAFETGVKRREIPFNYCNMIEPPKCEKNSASFLSSDEIKKLVDYLNNYNILYSLPIMFALLLGLRRGEVLGLKWSDFDLSEKVVHIQRTATPHKNGYVYSDCKTEQSQRFLSIPDLLFNRLIEWQKIQLSFSIPNNDDFVFFQSNGKVFSSTTLNKKYKEILTACCLDSMRFHDLRHSFASYLVSENVPINTISQMLGHSKTSTTLDIYTHTDIKKQKLAIDKLNNINGF